MPDCQEISLLVSKGLDKKLSLPERITVRLHLLICSGCRNFSRQTRFISKASHDYLNHLQSGTNKKS